MADDVPAFLYRYRPLLADGTRDVVRDEIDLIRNGFIWTSHPKDLNDPFDCLPICAPNQQSRLDELLAKFFVGSMSAVAPDRIEASPMWSYYANNHRGICIEFPVTAETMALRLPIEKVRYHDERVDVSHLDPAKMRITAPRRIGVVVAREEIEDPANNIDILDLTRKSTAWKHEEEWRYIWPAHREPSREIQAQERERWGPKSEHKVFISRPVRVILGANMEPATKARVTGELTQIGVAHVTASLSAKDYKIYVPSLVQT